MDIKDKLMRMILTALLAASTCLSVAHAAKLPAESLEQIKGAVDKGLRLLRAKQDENGSYGNHVGLTAMVLLAFAESHRAYRADDGPFIGGAVDWLTAQARADGAITGEATPTYNTALAILALQAIDPVKHKKLIEGGQRFLVGFQTDEDLKYKKTDKFYGGIGYGGDERPDLSNLQYALEALRKTDYDANSDVWAKADVFLSRCQNNSETNDQDWAGNDGGFVYAPGQSVAGGTTSYGSMTFAGLKSLMFSKVKKDDPRVQAAWGWIQRNYDFNAHPGLGTTGYYYYLQTAGASLEAFGEDFVPDEKGRKRAWMQDLATRILSLQKTDGSWINEDQKYWEGNPILGTARAVSTLNYIYRAALR
ncbi:terpene cyclase/mutase family protein [Myxococcota bacterium]|nr:terpene cyclase/mutase family protein [Myxococcota bacterium]MBU1429770.1 terpene cyclase/mutase family protein [Myxococcota bacterium]MBU1898718.1 terpene cyclase/mutase family protein [Myxococcota bacterium]